MSTTTCQIDDVLLFIRPDTSISRFYTLISNTMLIIHKHLICSFYNPGCFKYLALEPLKLN